MKKSNVKTRALLIGFVLGLILTALFAMLITVQKLGIAGIFLVLASIFVSFTFGRHMGNSIRTSCTYDRAWNDGYREGKIDATLKIGASVPKFSKRGKGR